MTSTESSGVLRDFIVDRKLINANFDGYKLCLDSLAIGQISLDVGLDLPKLSSDLYSYQHLKLFGIDNKLFADPWDESSLWFVDSNWRIIKVKLAASPVLQLSQPEEYYRIPDVDHYRSNSARYSVSLNFCSEEWLVISDGSGRLIIVKSDDRRESPNNLKVFYKDEPLGKDIIFKVLHADHYNNNEGKHYIEVLCAHVVKNPLAEISAGASNFITSLEWLSFSLDSNCDMFELVRRRTLHTLAAPECAVIIEKGSKLMICCEKPVQFVSDSLKPLVENDCLSDEKKELPPLYTWIQKGQEITIYVKLDKETSSSDVTYNLCCDHIDLKLNKSDEVIFSGQLFDKVVVDQCTWTISDNALLEIHLEKVDKENIWSEVVKEDTRGQLVFDEEQIAAINEQLAPFTSETEETEIMEKGFNTQQLEDCDSSDVSSVFYCFDGDTHKIFQQINLSSHQWLFCSRSTLSTYPIGCIRHDVDGLVLKLQPNQEASGPMWVHVATFNAFGYVQASKQQRKFTVCAPNFSYVAIVDLCTHIFVYRQPAPSSLKSRKTGENVTVAKQQMITLDTNDAIEGALATNNNLFLITKQCLFCIRINQI